MENLPEIFTGTLGVVFVIAVAIVAALWGILSLCVPFLIYGISRRSKEQLAAQHEANRLLRMLAHRDSPERDEFEDSRNPFR